MNRTSKEGAATAIADPFEHQSQTTPVNASVLEKQGARSVPAPRQALAPRQQTPLSLGLACDVSEINCCLDIVLREHRALYHVDIYNRGPGAEVVAKARAWIASEAYSELIAALEQATDFASDRDVRSELACLVGAFPNAARADLKAFGALLALDVLSKAPSKYAISAAVIKLRQTCRFVPTITEVLEAIAAADEHVRHADRWAREMPKRVEKLERDLAEIEEKERAYQADLERRREKGKGVG